MAPGEWLVEPADSRQQGARTRREHPDASRNMAVLGSLRSDESVPTLPISHERIKKTWEGWGNRDI